MKISFELSDKEKYQIESGWASEVDMCIRHGIFEHETISQEDRDAVDKVLKDYQDRFYGDDPNKFVYCSEYVLIQTTVYHPDVQAQVVGAACVPNMWFSDWYEEFLEYIYYAAYKMKRDHKVIPREKKAS